MPTPQGWNSILTDPSGPVTVIRTYSTLGQACIAVKLVWLEVICLLSVFYSLWAVHSLFLDEHGKIVFAKAVGMVRGQVEEFDHPTAYLLGFFVTLSARRWWDQYQTLPWPDDLLIILTGLNSCCHDS